MMKYTLLLFMSLYCCTSLSAQERVYLSPVGSDQGDGSRDKPYYSLNQAVKNRLNTSSTDTLFVEVAAGQYSMNAPFTLTQPTSRPVVIRSQGIEKPVFLGAVPITGWEKCANGLWRAYVPQVLGMDFRFEQFFVNGKRAQMARTPNADWYYVKGSSETSFVKGVRLADYATQKIEFSPEELASLKNLSTEELNDVRIRFYHKWDNTRKKIGYLHTDSGYIYMSGSGLKPWNPITKGSRYIIYNYKDALDSPREWYLDRQSGYLYYLPAADEDMTTAQCYAPAIRRFVCFEGEDGSIKNISFRNLSFQYTAYLLPEKGDDPEQAAASASAAMMFDRVENISLTDCEILHTGSYAVWLRESCLNNRIERCYLADLGAGGIKIGTNDRWDKTGLLTAGNAIHNNIITEAGSEFPCGVGVALFFTSDNQVTHNEISDLRYSGVSVGWIWGYADSPSVRNKIEYNHIHHIGWGELSDMGAVYTLGISPGTTVSNNVIHDVLSYDYGGWGLYTDEGSTGVEMKNNLVYRCKSGGFHQHYGRENIIENNIFAYGHYYQAQYTRVEAHRSFSFKHNIILQDKGETLAGPWSKGQIDIDSNCYWYPNGKLSLAGVAFDVWKKTKEPHAVLADPLFKDAANDDYRFRSLKTANKIGFVPFDYTQAGVYGDKEWQEKATLSPEKIAIFQEVAKVRLKK